MNAPTSPRRLRQLLTNPEAPGLALLVAMASCGGDAAQRSVDPGETRTVAVVVVESLRRDALGCYGREGALTPRIDALAAEGARFEQAISASCWTLPSVGSLLTGTWPAVHKGMGKAPAVFAISEDVPLAAEVFREAGFGTLGFANSAYLSPLLGFDRGFDVYDHLHGYNETQRRAGATVEAALEAVAERPRQDLFLFIHLQDPHLDLDPPEEFITPFVGERRTPTPPLTLSECRFLAGGDGETTPSDEDIAYVRGLYQGEVAAVDAAVGRLVDGLEELGRWERTEFVLTAGQGTEFWTHRAFGHGYTLYDQVIRVPLVVRRPPSAADAPRVLHHVVRTIDVMPTLFELSGIETGPTFDGRSLVGDLRGQVPRRLPPAFSQGTIGGAEKISWRNLEYHLIVTEREAGEVDMELFDLVVDPAEAMDVDRTRPEALQPLSVQLMNFTNELRMRSEAIPPTEIQDLSRETILGTLESSGG